MLQIELYVPPKPYRVRRSWFDRLCTRPWRPWIITRTIVPPPLISPYDAYQIDGRIIAGAHVYEMIRRMVPTRQTDKHAGPL